ncbi:MAG: hypothetical protein RLW87_20690 [Alphaproteobacteria bacterium]
MNELTRLLKDCGLSQQAAADLLGVHRVTVSQQARGAATASYLHFLIAAWEQLTDEQREAVKKRLSELRR